MIKKEFASLVKEHRKLNSMSQQDLADKCGLTRAIIFNIESEKQNVYLEQALRIAEVLKFDISKMKLEDSDEIQLNFSDI